MAGQPLNEPAEIPAELDRWNWGAFFLNWIWGIGNSTFIALLALIPVVNIVMIIVLGARGSRWAWQNRTWRDAEQFRKTQRNWGIAGLVVWVVAIGGLAASISSIPYVLKGNDAYRMTMDTVRANANVKAEIGDDVADNYWIGGSVNVDANGAGDAKLSIPLHGAKGKGTAYSHAVRTAGAWSMRLLVVWVEGVDTPIVLVNEDHVPIPNAAIGI
ncbi:cytochrome c oxidase assembly factor 1 family protein [Mesorhizobium sp. PAMC28654]|uniref:cytochrome c oxidase assembly factor Coa1 family protein n=1 Tax=Mesorhizobium sp. PAMC28654 TaxID=2880934 RepID=UPI001D0A2F2E|nr:cytochrome c oxidase assembly factor Coa1 family protein [Mesorhizobium sp. PAMC28654]UDL89984.1 cytochrome c oxidase assembly factor 1 family protein [Mesorhizobium sp. PAMC28654]